MPSNASDRRVAPSSWLSPSTSLLLHSAMPSARRVAPSSWLSPSTTLLFLIAFRLANALSLRTFFQPDEFFQSLEPAWQIVFGKDQGAWVTWVSGPASRYPDGNGNGALPPAIINTFTFPGMASPTSLLATSPPLRRYL